MNDSLKYLCSTCKGKCNKSIIVTKTNNISTIKCVDYVKDEDKIQGYKKQECRTAKHEKALMKFSQEY